MTTRSKPTVAVITAVLVVLTTFTWWAFLGRDTVREIDASGNVTGPYQAPQVVACAVLLVALVVIGSLVIPAWLAVLGVALPFTAAWAIQAATSDDSGLWPVGGVLVLLGTLGGGAVVAVVTRALARRRNTLTPG